MCLKNTKFGLQDRWKVVPTWQHQWHFGKGWDANESLQIPISLGIEMDYRRELKGAIVKG